MVTASRLSAIRLVAAGLHADAAGHSAGFPPQPQPDHDHADRRGWHQPLVHLELVHESVAVPAGGALLPAAGRAVRPLGRDPERPGVAADPAGPDPVLVRLPGLPDRGGG